MLKPRPDFDHKLLNTTEWIDVPEDKHTSVSSAYITGPAGSGKSTLVSKLAQKDKAFILGPTWTAVDNLFQKGFRKGQAMNVKTDYAKTLGSCESVIIDEYTMASMANLAAIAKAVDSKDVLISGDPNQCIPVGNMFNVINKQNIIV